MLKPICTCIFLLVFFNFFILSECSGQQEAPVLLNEQEDFAFNETCWSYFESSDKDLTVEAVCKLYAQQKFKPVNSSVLNGGIPKKYYWFHFKVINPTQQKIPFIIDAKSPRINSIALYTLKNGAVVQQNISGDLLPFRKRPIIDKSFAFPAALAPADSLDFLLFVNQVGNSFYLPITISPVNVFNHFTYSDYLLNGITFGILLFVSLLSLIFFINTKHFIYLYYSLYIISSVLWVLSYFGLGFQYLWPNVPRINSIASPLLASVNILLTLQICQLLLQIKKRTQNLFTVITSCKIILLVTGLFPVVVNLDTHDYAFNHTYLIIFLGVIISSIIVLFYSVLFYTIKGSQEAFFYLIASIFKISSMFNLALMELGITPAISNLEMLLQCGLIVELTLLSYALAKRYKGLKIKSYNAILKAQETERHNLAQEMHDNISNTLAGIKFQLHYIIKQAEKGNTGNIENDLAEIYDVLDTVQSDTRNISHNLMPENIHANSLGQLASSYMNNITKRSNSDENPGNIPQFSFSTNEKKNVFMPDTSLQIFRIIQELITNAIKHSRATRATLIITYEKRYLEIIVEDNGIGINGRQNKEGLGLRNIRSRIELLNGNMEIKAVAPFDAIPGTHIIIRIPYRTARFDTQSNY
jgi:signal transduction histidine kinase